MHPISCSPLRCIPTPQLPGTTPTHPGSFFPGFQAPAAGSCPAPVPRPCSLICQSSDPSAQVILNFPLSPALLYLVFQNLLASGFSSSLWFLFQPGALGPHKSRPALPSPPGPLISELWFSWISLTCWNIRPSLSPLDPLPLPGPWGAPVSGDSPQIPHHPRVMLFLFSAVVVNPGVAE